MDTVTMTRAREVSAANERARVAMRAHMDVRGAAEDAGSVAMGQWYAERDRLMRQLRTTERECADVLHDLLAEAPCG